MRWEQVRKKRAIAVLNKELREFNHDGLVQLKEDLKNEKVLYGSWDGCVISYKRGAPGSVRCDRVGLACNVFTLGWDSGQITTQEVLAAVDAEIERRKVVEVQPLVAV